MPGTLWERFEDVAQANYRTRSDHLRYLVAKAIRDLEEDGIFRRLEEKMPQDTFSCYGVKTWRELYEALRQAGFLQAANFIESWQDEYLPEQEDEPLPRESR